MANLESSNRLQTSAIEARSPENDAVQPRIVKSDELFGGGRQIYIEHGGQQYRLLITRNDRLILQK